MNQHCINIYCSNYEYKNLLDTKFKVFLDGFGVYLTLKLFGYNNVQRFNATDLNEKLFNYFSEKNTRLYLIGGQFNDEFIKEKALQRSINVTGYYNGFFNEEDFGLVCQKINIASPDVIIIGMGVPKQELLALKLEKIIRTQVIICVGNFLEFYFGTKKRAPVLIKKSGFEWLFRLATEPSRLWKRYLVGIPVFFVNMIRLKFSKSKN